MPNHKFLGDTVTVINHSGDGKSIQSVLKNVRFSLIKTFDYATHTSSNHGILYIFPLNLHSEKGFKPFSEWLALDYPLRSAFFTLNPNGLDTVNGMLISSVTVLDNSSPRTNHIKVLCK